ncbi:MAG: MotA/TolQ/ExbB proton channel family protein, partial [Pseudomonadota bacterium]
ERVVQALPTLKVMAGVQPLLGLLGTITGLLSTFSRMAAAGGLDPGQLASGGIAVAMLTTQAGLLMAVPSLIGIYALEERLRRQQLVPGESVEATQVKDTPRASS